MSELFPLSEINGVSYVDSRLIAKDLNVNHKSFLETIRRHKPKIESKFGILPFETAKLKTAGRPVTFCYLNEGQCIFVTLLSRNSERVIDVKLKVTETFLKAKQTVQQLKVPTQLELAEQVVLLLKQQAIDAPKVQYVDEVLQSKSTLTTTQVAKDLGFRSAIALNKALADRSIQFKPKGTKQWVLTADYADKGYTKTKTHKRVDNITGETITTIYTVWTEKGRHFLHTIFPQLLNLK